jgi:hypothetical protein
MLHGKGCLFENFHYRDDAKWTFRCLSFVDRHAECCLSMPLSDAIKAPVAMLRYPTFRSDVHHILLIKLQFLLP